MEPEGWRVDTPPFGPVSGDCPLAAEPEFTIWLELFILVSVLWKTGRKKVPLQQYQ